MSKEDKTPTTTAVGSLRQANSSSSSVSSEDWGNLKPLHDEKVADGTASSKALATEATVESHDHVQLAPKTGKLAGLLQDIGVYQVIMLGAVLVCILVAPVKILIN